MRALRVVGVTGDGSVVLEDPGRRERYTVPADEQLRAAARGDVTRLGQIAIELESQLRPREIQARIRGGASVDEVAAAAGVPVQKIERFAYPVLLERSRTAELAQGAHPQRADGPDSRTLGETVAHTFGLRGQDHTGAGWDSWRGEDGKWVVVLTWQTGRSDNAAHWAFQPGAHGGTVVALDEHASDLVEGLPARPLRPLGAVVDMPRDGEPAPVPGDDSTAAPARAVAGGQTAPPADTWGGRGIAPEQRRSSPQAGRPARPASRPDRDETRAPAAPASGRPAAEAPAPTPAPEAPAAGTPVVAQPSDGVGEATTPAPQAGGRATAPSSHDARPGAVPALDRAAASRSSDSAAASGGATPGGTVDALADPRPAAGTPAGAGGDTATPGATSAPGDAATPGGTAPADDAPVTGSTVAGASDRPASESPDAPSSDAPSGAATTGTDSTGADSNGTGSTGGDATGTDAQTGEETPAGEPKPRTGTAASRRTRKGKPVMPSWDEVLLGVRGQR